MHPLLTPLVRQLPHKFFSERILQRMCWRRPFGERLLWAPCAVTMHPPATDASTWILKRQPSGIYSIICRKNSFEWRINAVHESNNCCDHEHIWRHVSVRTVCSLWHHLVHKGVS